GRCAWWPRRARTFNRQKRLEILAVGRVVCQLKPGRGGGRAAPADGHIPRPGAAMIRCPFPDGTRRAPPPAVRRVSAGPPVVPDPIPTSMDAWPRCLERLEAELPAEDVHT